MKRTETLSGQAVLLNELIQIIVEPVLAESGISIPIFDLLNAISSAKTGATQASIAASLRVTPPTLCESVKIAVREELIVQDAHPRDKRAKRLQLTTKGRKILNRASAKLTEAEAAMIAGIDQADLEAAVTTLSAAVRNLARFDQLEA
jgi:DNA-binding MarR family transcriptional regulator